MTLVEQKYTYAVGRRKSAVAQVRLFLPGYPIPGPNGEGAVMFSCKRKPVFSWKRRHVFSSERRHVFSEQACPQKHHRVIVLPKLCQSFVQNLSKCCQSCVKVVSACCQRCVKVLSTLCHLLPASCRQCVEN